MRYFTKYISLPKQDYKQISLMIVSYYSLFSVLGFNLIHSTGWTTSTHHINYFGNFLSPFWQSDN